MEVIVRADASAVIGTGHVRRCLTLAESLRDRGAGVRFVMRTHPGHLADQVERRGFAVTRLPVRTSADLDTPYGAWLGSSWREDADETHAACGAAGGDGQWVVVDHYAIDARWETAMRSAGRSVLAIDDLADRPHRCDLLLDQNLVGGMDARYASLLPSGCTTLLGPRYALLQPEYAALHGNARVRAGLVRRMLVCFGGVGDLALTVRGLEAICAVPRPGLEVDVVLPGRAEAIAEVRSRFASRMTLRVHPEVRSLAPLFAETDLCLGSGGSSTWERLCLGVPSLVVTVAANQRPVAEAAHADGLIRWLGDSASLCDDALAEAVQGVLQGPLDPAWSARCLAVVDGEGSRRVCDAVMRSRPVPSPT